MKKIYFIVTFNLAFIPLPLFFYLIEAENKHRAQLRVKNGILGKFQFLLLTV